MLYGPRIIYTKVVPPTDTHFAVPFAPSFPFISILLHFDGTDASTVMTDATGRHALTANGAAQLDTAQFVFGTASFLNDGAAGSYISVSNNLPDFTFDGNYTIDSWLRVIAFGASGLILVHSDPSLSILNRYFLQVATDGTVNFNINGTAVLSSVDKVQLNTWTHLAITRFSNTTRLFFQGILQGLYNGTETLNVGSALIVGARGDGAAFNVNGWMDETRILKGAAAWTGGFTPPTSPYTPPP